MSECPGRLLRTMALSLLISSGAAGQKLVLALSPGKRQLDGCARDVTASLRDRSAIKFVLESDRRIGRPDRVNVFSREPADMLCWLL